MLGCTLHELGERLTGEEFGLWLALLEVEPMGPAQLMVSVAELKAELRNGPVGRKDGRHWMASDFMDVDRWQPPAVNESTTTDSPSLATLRSFAARGKK